MTVGERTGSSSAGSRRPLPGRTYGLLAGALLLLSALLQGLAAMQRWVFVGLGDVGADRSIEDHLFDYVIPADPWVSVGSAATLFGLGYLLIGAALILLGVASRAIADGVRGVVAVALVAAVPFVLAGVHALVSGLSGFASPLQYLVAAYGAFFLGAVQVAALILFAAFVARRSWIWAIAVLLLIGLSVFGYVGAMVIVAPVLVGYQSYDTTPWTEGVLAANTAVAALVICIGCLRLRTGLISR